MNYFIAAFGIFMITLALTVMIHPGVLKEIIYPFLKKKWLWPVSIIRISLGAGFIYTSTDTSSQTLILILGIIFILVGAAAPILGSKKVEELANWWMNQKEISIRVFGFFTLLFGIAVAMAGLPS